MSQLSYNTAIHLEATTHLVANSYSDEACFQSTLSMDPGQYQNRPQALGLSLGYSYDGTSLQSSQSLLPMPSNDGLPRVPNQQLMNLYPHNVYNYSIAPSMSIPQSSNDWVLPSQSSPGFDNQINNTCYSYGGDLACMDQGTNHPRDANIPRSWMQCDPSMLDDNSMVPNYDSATYMLGPVREASTSDSLVEEHPESSRDFARLSICHSPKFENGSLGADTFSYQRAPGPRLLASESSDDSLPGSREMTTIDMEDPTTVDEPYAKLIYRALMSAPDHSMVLQEIYQWFRDNTTKGSSDTKGWMNSIRHNLSMNAAFKKTERKILGDETKKSTEWVLEDFAIRDGVQSTTRYRTKSTGVKKILRSDNPTPSKQTSGRKGGICSSKGKFQRRSKDERSDMRQSTPRFDLGGRSNFSFEDMTPQAAQRQLSPLTPTPESMPASSPFFMPKVEQFDVPYEDMYTLEEVQGVYADDTPLFSNNHGQVFHGAHAICASRY